MKVKKGISLIVLVVTIIVMIIIAGAIIISLSNTNIIDQAEKATTKWSVSSIKEQLNIHNALAKTGMNTEIKNGSLKEIGIDDEEWNSKLVIQEGKLVFLPENVKDNEEQALIDAGVERAPEHISIVNASTKTSKYANENNVVAVADLYEKLAKNSEDTGKIIYILEDLESWDATLGGIDFYAILDGLGHSVTNLQGPMLKCNYGTIRGITFTGDYDASELGYWANAVEINKGLIEYCHNKANIYGNATNVGGIAGDNYGMIYRCSNTGQVSGELFVGGIVAFNFDTAYKNNREYYGAQIIECFNSGKVGAWDESGNKILESTVSGVGGIVGYNSGVIYFENSPGVCINCYNVGDVAGSEYVAGISGYPFDGGGYKYTIKNSYNAGDVNGSSDCGAITSIVKKGLNLINVFSIKIPGLELVGDKAGGNLINVDWINNLVNDGDTETEADRDKLLEMLNAGNTEEVWVKDINNINNGYPILKWQLAK